MKKNLKVDMQFEGKGENNKVVFDFINKLSADINKLAIETVALWEGQMDTATLTVCSQAAVIKSIGGFFGALQHQIDHPKEDKDVSELTDLINELGGIPPEVEKQLDGIGLGGLTANNVSDQQVTFLKHLRKNVLTQLKLAVFQIEERISEKEMYEINLLVEEATKAHLQHTA